MATYLLSWNPTKSPDDFTDRQLARLRQSGRWSYRWRTVRTRVFPVGSRVFVVRTGVEPKGIMASGWTTREPYAASGSWFVGVEFDSATREPAVSVEQLVRNPRLRRFRWLIEGSGVEIPSNIAAELEAVWRKAGGSNLPTHVQEVDTAHHYPEGAVRRILVNAYERDPRARASCINHYGVACVVCGFSFERQYGPEFAGWIHVHHLRELSAVGRRHRVNPVRDMRPLCPNCHAVAHSSRPAVPIERIKRLVAKRGAY